MPTIEYVLGAVEIVDQLFPPVREINDDVGLRDQADVVAHFTLNSLIADGFTSPVVDVTVIDGAYVLAISADNGPLDAFAERHAELFGPDAGMKAIRGRELLEELGVWNPMAGYRVNTSPTDLDSKWCLFPPLGLNVVGQRGALLMHYPPWQVLQQATFTKVMTWHRWMTVLTAAGVPTDQTSRFGTFVDVNPIAAPGSGESEYPNDYFPIMMASGFFDGGPDRDYIVSMLERYLRPPGYEHPRYTLPLLVCGSPLYDPQAPGWFRVAFKDQIPPNADGIVPIDVLQFGTIRLRPDSDLETPYMVANHQIAAGVTGHCTDDPTKIPDIRMYEAQDLAAASFLWTMANDVDLSVDDAAHRAITRWFGNPNGDGPPTPDDPEDACRICALAQMDLFFEPTPWPHPTYEYDPALAQCCGADNGCDPCAAPIAPPPGQNAPA